MQFSTKIEVMVSEENAEPILVESNSGGGESAASTLVADGSPMC